MHTPRRLLALVLLLSPGCSRPPAPAPDAATADDDAGHDAASVLDAWSRPDVGRDAASWDAYVPDAPTPAEYHALYADLLCDAVLRCAPSERYYDPYWSCANRVAGTAAYDPYQQAIDEGRMSFDASAAAACLRALLHGCDYGASSTDPGPCGSVYVGQVADGAPCHGYDCGPNSYCSGGFTCGGHGTCVPRPRAGEPCDGGQVCAVGTMCFSPTCQPVTATYVGLGEVCNGATLRCRQWLDCRGTCVDPSIAGWPGEGDRCSGTEERCAVDRTCEGGLCVPRHAAGERCQSPITGCVLGAHCMDQVCIAYGRLGDPCDTTSRPCALGTHCLGGVCALSRLPGETCTAGTDCTTGYCDAAGACAACW